MAHFEDDFPTSDVVEDEDEDEAKEAEIDVAWDAYVAFLPGWVRARKLTAWRRNLRELLACAPIHDRDYRDALAPDQLLRAGQRK